MSKFFVAFTVLAAAVVALVGVLIVLSLPQFNANAAFQPSAMPTLGGGTQVPTVAVTTYPTVMPTSQPSQPAPTSIPTTGGTQYVVQAGDTMGDIAVRYGVSLAALLAANPQITNPNLIFPGQVINIPAGGTTPGGNPTSIPNTGGNPTSVPNTGNTGGFYYVVQQGDTLSSIASKYGVSLQALTNANPNLVQPGAVIFVPNGSSGPGVPPTGGGTTYVVQSGDTLGAIAARYNTTVNAILQANPQITNPNLIFPGQVIQLPSGSSIPPTGGGNTYIVQSGDTLGAIAARFGVTLQALLAANPAITNPNFILPGQVITIPSGGTVPPTGGGNTYTVVAGDTLFAIATAHGTTVQALLNLNPQITNANLIFPGQVIKLR